MPEYDSIEKLPEYTQANVDYQIALQTAGEDQTAALTAKLAWSEKKQALELERQRINTEYRAINEARERVKAEYPDVPEDLFATVNSPEEMFAAAKRFDEAVKAKIGAAITPVTEPTPSSAAIGQPPTGLSGGNQLAPDDQWAGELQDLRQKINEGRATRQEVEYFQDIKMGKQMLPAALRAKQEAKAGK